MYSKGITGAPGRTRTRGPRFRKPMAMVNQSQYLLIPIPMGLTIHQEGRKTER